MAKFTPGPWRVKPHKTNTARIDADGWTKFARVYVRVGGLPSEEGEANARLIAAAPDLLAALQNIRASRQNGHNESEAWGWVDAAIAKATGAQP